MTFLSAALRERPILRGALIVPSVIALIFSLFNLTVAPDPAAMAAHVTIATVNEDTGLPFPPVNMASRMIEGLGSRLPMHLQAFDTEASARAALEAEEVAALIVFPADFSTAIAGQGPVPLTLVTSGSLTMGEAQMTGALPAMLESGVASAVQGIRLALAQGRMPDMTPPVALQSEVLNAPVNAAARMAPFIANFVTALSALVGGIIGWVGTRGLAGTRGAALRTLFPVIALPLSAAVLAAIVTSLAGGSFLALWLAVAGLGIAFGWFFAGSLALFGPLALVVLVPLVFWQPALGGAQMPLAAGPAWLQNASVLGLDQIGGHYRAILLGGSTGFPWALAGIAAVAGLTMIWLRGALVRQTAPVAA
ncbi:ABC transporter permease [Pararhodobacter sp. CCB-MM2]|uniref:ABC transporter permease n=1 Tax=Pararhodobacter sp. CCB-MM2 TaxID=1786003 RepID=UPI00082CF5C4|nr:ABC transporter permease [Pararhodobacter sp. CCB-MM2]